MISHTKQQGFTIVELLIVIVVIAILAALSYVGYTSITARANNSTAAATAKAVKDAAQVYAGANGSWPTTRTHLTSGGTDAVAKLPTDITFEVKGTNTYVSEADGGTAVQALTSNTAAKSVTVYPCGSPAAGFRIYYKNFTGTTAKFIDAGDCSTAPVAGALGITQSS